MLTFRGFQEKDLIERIRNGDQTAFEIIFKAYYPGLIAYATQFTFDHRESEEIVQDFFVRLWQKHQSILPSESLKNYFFQSVKNKSFNFLKHKKTEEKYIIQLTSLSESHLVYDPELYVDSILQGKIKQSIDLLPERCKEIFLMSRFKGLKNDEIANRLDLSKRTVETQISNAIRILKVELKDYVGLLFLLGLIK